MNAVKAITTIHTAETQYYSQYGQYAISLTELGTAGLIDHDLARGNKGGFKFALRPSGSGYAVPAVPARFGVTGRHIYYSDPSLEIHQYDDRRPATPADPIIGRTVRE
jgi:hypothetical protein